MKIEYFDILNQEEPVVLIYGNEPENVAILKDAVHDLAVGERDRVAVYELPGYEGVDGCQLFFSAGTTERGVWLISRPKTFECSIRPLWWDNIEGLLEPFCKKHNTPGFQDLDYGFYSKIRLIISTDRGW
jgi:hypothetical protein